MASQQVVWSEIGVDTANQPTILNSFQALLQDSDEMKTAGDFMRGTMTAGEVQEQMIIDLTNAIADKKRKCKELEALMHEEADPEKYEKLRKEHMKLGAEVVKDMKKKQQEENRLRAMMNPDGSAASGGDGASKTGGSDGASKMDGGEGASKTGGSSGGKGSDV